MADLDDIKEGKDFGIDRPQQNTLYTLKGCGSLDWGMQSRLARIFNPHSNRTVMLAFDHGYFQGPTTGLERIDLSIAPLFADTDVLMCTRGVLRSQVPAATNKPVVLRASGGNSILSELSNECVAVAMEDALRSTFARWRRRSISAANTNISRSITSSNWWMPAIATVCRSWRLPASAKR